MKPNPKQWQKVVKAVRHCQGLTLIEMIGVLAILAIVTAAITPVAVRRVDLAARTKEFSDLNAISNAIVMQIIRADSIPGTTGSGWATNVATWLNQPVTNIVVNPRKFQRLYMADPTSSPSLPYTQSGNVGWGGQPYDGRVMVVSSIARTNVPSGIDFNETWNWNNVLNPTAKPASWSTFPGNGDDVCIERINIQSLFYQLILVNRDQAPPGATNAPFNINGTYPPYIITNLAYANGSIFSDWYLAGTTLGLWSTNNNSSGTNALAITYIINQNSSFVFENGTWNLQIQGCLSCTNAPPPSSISNGLASAYNQAAISFFNSLWNSGTVANGGKGATQTAVLSAFGNYMMDYTMWADATSNGVAMPFNSNGNNNNNLPMTLILNGEVKNVDQITGTQGNGGGSFTGLLHE
jgi:prepilin-type N-terminal cleavage/methylation domain-containing protein